MPHIDGHIQDAPESCGILSPSANQNKGLFFIPPAFKVKPGDEVGFHLLEIPGEGGSTLIAYDLVERVRVNGKLTEVDEKAEKKSDTMYRKTKEYAKFYSRGRKSASQVIRSVMHKLKAVDELRETKKTCEFISERLMKSEAGKSRK